MFFFFQAEDGIRDLVRSRGLGDVYKRQRQASDEAGEHRRGLLAHQFGIIVLVQLVQFDESTRQPRLAADLARAQRPEAVSYTHLTLPTSDLA